MLPYFSFTLGEQFYRNLEVNYYCLNSKLLTESTLLSTFWNSRYKVRINHLHKKLLCYMQLTMLKSREQTIMVLADTPIMDMFQIYVLQFWAFIRSGSLKIFNNLSLLNCIHSQLWVFNINFCIMFFILIINFRDNNLMKSQCFCFKISISHKLYWHFPATLCGFYQLWNPLMQIAFMSTQLTDGGRTLLETAGRVVKEYRGRGVYGRLQRLVRDRHLGSPHLCYINFALNEISMAVYGQRLLKTYQQVAEKVCSLLKKILEEWRVLKYCMK